MHVNTGRILNFVQTLHALGEIACFCVHTAVINQTFLVISFKFEFEFNLLTTQFSCNSLIKI